MTAPIRWEDTPHDMNPAHVAEWAPIISSTKRRIAAFGATYTDNPITGTLWQRLADLDEQRHGTPQPLTRTPPLRIATMTPTQLAEWGQAIRDHLATHGH